MVRCWLSYVYVNTLLMVRCWLSYVYVNALLMVRCWRTLLTFLFFSSTRCWRYAVDFLVLKRCWWYTVDFPMFLLTRCWCYAVDCLVCMLAGSWLHWCVARTPLDAIRCSRVASKARSPTNFGFHSAVQKECAAGLVRVSPSDTFKAARLQWLRQMKKFPTVPAGQAFEKTCKGEDWQINKKPHFLAVSGDG